MTKPKRRPSGSTIGAILVGFDQDVFRTLPPAQELVARSRPIRGVSGQAPGLEITFPEDLIVDAGEPLAEPPLTEVPLTAPSGSEDQSDEAAPEA